MALVQGGAEQKLASRIEAQLVGFPGNIISSRRPQICFSMMPRSTIGSLRSRLQEAAQAAPFARPESLSPRAKVRGDRCISEIVSKLWWGRTEEIISGNKELVDGPDRLWLSPSTITRFAPAHSPSLSRPALTSQFPRSFEGILTRGALRTMHAALI